MKVEHMRLIILKAMIKKLIKTILNSQEKEIYVQIFVKYKKLMEQKNSLESLNEISNKGFVINCIIIII
jgi:hypothetical protein